MEALEAILSRRSIRRYTDKPVPPEVLKNMLAAGMSAPSASNFQPWQFIIITERKLLDEIPEFHPHAVMLTEAPLAILVCGSPGTSRYWQQDCAAATENILLAAHAQGLGAVWLGVYPREERVKGLRQLLNVPEDYVPMSLITRRAEFHGFTRG